MPLEHAAHGHGDGARFLGDDDHYRIGILTHAHTGPVPGAQVRRQPVAGGQGQHAACRLDFPLPDDHGAIVEGSLGEENIPDQLLGDLAVDGGPGLHIVFQRCLPGEDDQCAYLFPAHAVTGGHGLADDHIHLRHRLDPAKQGSQAHTAQMVQHPPQLRLEQNDQRQQSDGQELLHDEGHRIQMPQIGQPRNDQNHHHGLGNSGGAGCLDQRQDFIYQKRDYGDIQIV